MVNLKRHQSGLEARAQGKGCGHWKRNTVANCIRIQLSGKPDLTLNDLVADRHGIQVPTFRSGSICVAPV